MQKMSTSYIGKCTQSMLALGTHTSGQIYRQSMILEAADIKFSFVRDITTSLSSYKVSK